MNIVHTWRRSLAVLSVILVVVGVALAGYWLYGYGHDTVLDPVLSQVSWLLLPGTPCLAVLGLMALVVRWRLPHIAELEPGSRAGSIAILATVLVGVGAMVVIVMSVILVIWDVVINCAEEC